MRDFDESYVMLQEMYEDDYYPDELVDKIAAEIGEVVTLLEDGERDTAEIQTALDKMTLAINDLQDAFEEAGSEIETVARDCIGETVGYILHWFDIDIDVEKALAERDW